MYVYICIYIYIYIYLPDAKKCQGDSSFYLVLEMFFLEFSQKQTWYLI